MSITRKLVVIGTTGALSLGLVAVPALAQEDGPPTADQSGPRHDRRAEFRTDLAAELGIAVEDLEAAMQSVRDAHLDQLVADGTITQEELDAFRAAVEAGTVREYVEANGPLVEKPTDPDVIDANRTERREALAAELGISVDELEAAAVAVHEARLQEAIDSGRVSEDEAAEIRAAIADGTLDEYRQAQRAERLVERLAAAVEAGNITEQQAAEIQAAAEDHTLREYFESHPELRDQFGDQFADRQGGGQRPGAHFGG